MYVFMHKNIKLYSNLNTITSSYSKWLPVHLSNNGIMKNSPCMPIIISTGFSGVDILAIIMLSGLNDAAAGYSLMAIIAN